MKQGVAPAVPYLPAATQTSVSEGFDETAFHPSAGSRAAPVAGLGTGLNTTIAVSPAGPRRFARGRSLEHDKGKEQ